MERNQCDTNHLDSDSLLPPHKRLLAGLKKQAPDCHCEYEFRRINLLRSHLSNPNISIKEISEASNLAATKATENAEAKKAHAEQKAAKAAKAVATAKCALEIVANLEEEAAKKDIKFQKRNKSKKHVPVQALYGTKGENQNQNRNTNSGREDEEIARDLHRSINSLPRVSKGSPGPDILKGRKRKRAKGLASFSERNGDRNAKGLASFSERNGDICNGNGVKRIDMINVDENMVMGIRESKAGDDEVASGFLGKKRGRVKLKKLPLSVCTFRDQTSPKGEVAATCREDANNVEVQRVQGNGMCVAE